MTEQDQIATSPDSQKADTPAPARPARHGKPWIGYSILLLVVGLAGGIAFWLYELRTHQEGLGTELSKEDREIAELNTQVADLQTGFKTLHGQLAALETRVTTQDSQFERLIGEQSQRLDGKIDQTRAELGASLEHIQRVLGKTRTDWLVADAEFLLGAASQRLYLTGDAKTTLTAMEAADERLRESADPAIFKVREALAAEIHLLKDFAPPDLVGLSSRILALEAKVRDLPLHLPHAGTPVEKGEETPEPTLPSTSQQPTVINDALRELRGLVTVRHTEKPVGTVLSPEEAALLKEVLLLKLETARMALVRGDETLYRDSVASSRAWLAEHFSTDQAAVKDMDGALKALGEQGLKVAYPQIGKALSLLRDVSKLHLDQDKAKPAPAPAPPAAPESSGHPVEAKP
ncbi:MAG TPA: uroporphyrinogen-III C-methyltransferase [Methylococcaceae bacterium]|nr:uroporphyrinogen-III C-methyltransferase [Methylococcaceae bacterium]